MIIAFLIFLPFLLVFVVLGVYTERKVAAFIQDRIGPMETGKFGLLQTVADLVKLLQKEDIKPKEADKLLFVVAPVVVFVSVFAGFSVIPLTPALVGSSVKVGVFYLLAIVSLDVVGILMAGWGSNNKFSLYGALRSVSQIVSYEVPLGLSVLCVVMITQTLDLQAISYQQGTLINSFSESTQLEVNYLFGLKVLNIDVTEMGGFLTWNVIRAPFLIIVFVIFFVASLAEANRGPFDLPESESELIGGYHTEYSGFRWSVFMLAEYGVMLLVSFLAVILFFGGWNTPFPNIGVVRLAEWTSGMPDTVMGNIWGAFWLISKALILVFVQMWARFTYPRLRVDQLMTLCWKYLTPLALFFILISGVWRLLMI